MKKRHLLYFLIVAFLFTGCNDDDYDDYRIPPKMYSSERFEQYMLQNFDLDGDNHISISEAKNVKEIDCSFMNMMSLECLQFFTELEKLNCSHNSIDKIDLTKHTKLKELVCAYASRDSIIDLSNNVALEVLEYAGSHLKFLDLSRNVILRKLHCFNNHELASLDISNNKNLEEIYLSELYNTEIKPINLENSRLKRIHCSMVGVLNSLNLAGCDMLDSIHLQVFNKHVINVNLRGCSSLEYLSLIDGEYNFSGLSSCVKLEVVVINGNIDMKNFDPQNIPNLKKLYCFNNNRLTMLNLSNNNTIEELQLGSLYNDDNKSINLEGCTSLKDVYCGNMDNLNFLNLSGCLKLTNLHCDYLNNGFDEVNINVSGCSSLTNLNLTGGIYSVPDMKRCSQLKELRFNGDIDISYNTELEHVVLEYGYLLSPIPGNTMLKTLHCITVKDAEVFDLSNQLLLEELHCKGVIPVVVDKNKALRILNITSFFGMDTDKGETTLRLKDFPNLEEVRLNYYRKLSTLEVENCPKLKLLSAEYLYDSGIDTLKVVNCMQLRDFYCHDSNIKVLNILKCPDIVFLDCRYNQISELHLNELLKLRYLDCSNNRLSELDLRYNEDLSYLSCGGPENEINVYVRKNNSVDLYVVNGNVIYVD